MFIDSTPRISVLLNSRPQNKLKICHLNAQSITPHIDEFRDFFNDNYYDVIAISETWLTTNIVDAQICLPMFHLHRNDRKLRHGGGVAIYVRDTLSSRVVSCSSNVTSGYPEYLIIEIWSTANNKILLSTIYRPPNTAMLDNFEQEFDNLFHLYKNIVIIGDLNINLLQHYYESSYLTDFCNFHNLHLVNFTPTHHTASSHTWIDHCIVNDSSNVMESNQSTEPFLSGHDVISIVLDYNVPKQTAKIIKYRNWSLINQESIADSLCEAELPNIDNRCPIDDSVNCLNVSICNVVNSIAPERLIKVSRPPAPWITDDIRIIQRRRNKLYRVFRRTGYAYVEYCNVRRLVKQKITAAKREFFQSRFTYVRTPKIIWDDFRRLGLLKSTLSTCPRDLDINGLNSYFVSVGDASNDDQQLKLACITPYSINQFDFVNITPDDVKKNLSRITTSAVGPDGLSIRYYKRLISFYSKQIVDLFNTSLTRCEFPHQWKDSLIIPIPKIKDPRIFGDYRPISILCPLSKVLERCIYDQIIEYLVGNNILDRYQTGFMKGMSTQTALLRFCDDIRSGIDNRSITIAISFDFTKAFDSVNHLLLLKKLRAYNFSENTLKWFYSYLTNRRQAVRLENLLSSWKYNRSGVPQGSVLGPLLYAIFISDLGSLIDCNHIFYADDLIVYITCSLSIIDETIEKLNNIIIKINSWCTENYLRLNPDKTKAIILGSPQHVRDPTCVNALKIVVNGKTIEYVKSLKYLGVIIDDTLSWHEQAIAVSNRAMSCLARLKINNKIFNTTMRRKLVVALVFPTFDYCSAVFSNISGVLQTRLQRKFNACIRFIFQLRRYDHITPYRKQLGWLTLQSRREFLICCIVYKMLHLNHDPILRENFRILLSVRGRAARQNDVFYQPSCRTVSYEKSFLFSAIRLWNQLPSEIVAMNNYTEFRTACYTRFFERTTDLQ
ncbi:uncharacterized protein LOC130663635 [Microplitis mediator]|uniref:uncharacterized protein LOC130663635 n=1 Tax=Microplitis mediator TaxID=375433 RepID=UPI002557C5A4|nr:uncharacterized protein LOC130663635 [Microplitis mediator]